MSTVEATIAQAFMTFAILLVFGGFFVWALRTRQFHDVEEANRRLFGEREDAAQQDAASEADAFTPAQHERRPGE